MPYLRAGVTLCACLVLAVAAFGCGDDDSAGEADRSGSDGTSVKPIETASLTKAKYLKRANAICGKVEPEILSKASNYSEKHASLAAESEEELIAAMSDSVLVGTMQKAIDGLRRLGAPRGNEEQIEAIVVAMQEENDSAAASRITSYSQFGREFTGSGRLAEQYGLDFCIYSPALR